MKSGKGGKDPRKPGAAKSKAPKGKAPIAPPLQMTADTADERRAARNVAQIRNKLSAAMEDPHVREQIVRAMRNLLHEDDK